MQHPSIGIGAVVGSASSRYLIGKELGRGAFGIVHDATATAVDAQEAELKQEHRHVAIKIVRDVLGNRNDGLRVEREIRLLSHVAGKHACLLNLLDVFTDHEQHSGHNDPLTLNVYIVTERMETDLDRWIRNGDAARHREVVPWIMKQLLSGLDFLHQSIGVRHRDVKPSNVLVSPHDGYRVKICDFGLVKTCSSTIATHSPDSPGSLTSAWMTNTASSSAAPHMTEYVATRYYRAPELLMACSAYGTGVDIWAAGCVFAELLLQRPLFPGANVREQLMLITSTLGSLEEFDLHSIGNDVARDFVKTLAKSSTPAQDHRLALRTIVPDVNADDTVELLALMLTLSPKRRPSAEELLKHAFFRGLPAIWSKETSHFEDHAIITELTARHFTAYPFRTNDATNAGLHKSNFIATSTTSPTVARRPTNGIYIRRQPRLVPALPTTTTPPFTSTRRHSPWDAESFKFHDWAMSIAGPADALSPATLDDEFDEDSS